jgi:purine-binding chemotaxis protein CheW
MDSGSPSSAADGPPSSRRAPASESASTSRADGTRAGVSACVFWLFGQRFALDTVDVVEAITLQQLVPIPLSPPWLIGLTSLRGTPLPVVELHTVLVLPAPGEERPGLLGHPALVLRAEGILFGGRVDRIEAVYAFESGRLEQAAAGEHPAVRGLFEVGRTAAPATLLDHDELSRRVSELRFRAKWEGSEGERRHVTKA